ncbi:MAG: insulinase family protein [Bacteroidia bacterium]|nr:insulinase family protein [Bacteroidia bacterium]
MKYLSILKILLVIVCIACSQMVFAQETGPIPVDPTIKTGKFNNGLTYYIMKNSKPEHRVELRLAVRTGSITEDNDQRGLAHFCEHMAFNGTKNFPRQDLVSYLESIGVDFGSDLNASTSFDETIYKLKVPTDNAESLEKGFQVLEDWAHNVTYDNMEIDKERGVILEEWRLGKGAEDRIWRKQMPVIFYNSHYAEREVIGDTAIILHAPHDALRRYYKDWYRPELMAVIAVGDMDMDKMYDEINKHFGKLTNPQNPRKRIDYDMPDNPGILVSVESDKELSYPSASVSFKYPARDNSTYESNHSTYVENLVSSMLYTRFNEISNKPNPPFTFSRSYFRDFEGNKRTFNLDCGVKGADAKTAYQAMLTEAFRAYQNGFTAGELERVKANLLSGLQRTYNEREKTESGRLVNRYVSNFIYHNAIPGFEKTYQLGQKEIAAISLEEVNACIKKAIKKDDVVVLISMPEKEGFTKPNAGEIKEIFLNMFSGKLDPYLDDASDKPLFTDQLTPGKVTSVNELKEAGAYEWKLSNGARVVLKPTDFKNDNISMRAFSYGGLAMGKPEDHDAIEYADNIIDNSGIADFTDIQLSKKLAGKIAGVTPSISNYSEGLNGMSSVKDFETLLQLTNLYFTKPRKDPDAFKSYKEKTLAQIANSKNEPSSAFSDTIKMNMYQKHPWIKPTSTESAGKMDLDKSFDFFRDRFRDASDFTFIFVGSFRPDEIKPLIEKYLGSIPSINRNEKIKDVGLRFADKNMVKKVYKGIEKKSSVAIRITGNSTFTTEDRYLLNSLMEVLDIRLREVVREDMGGTYGIYAYSNISKLPVSEYNVSIGWGCNPDRIDELLNAVKGILNEIRSQEEDTSYINKVKEIQKRRLEVDLKDNDKWMSMLYNCYYFQTDPKEILINETYRKNLTAAQIKQTASKYLKDQVMEVFELLPETMKK